MDLAVFEQLLSPLGQSALTAAAEWRPTERAFLPTFEKLRKQFPADLAKAAVESAILRVKAAGKFPLAERMYFTREALEQSSSAAVARHRANRYRNYPQVADLCCGIGADALALASVGCRVVAIERDPLRARMAEANLAACGFAEQSQVIVGDVLADAIPKVDAVLCDPSRRSDGKRFLSVDDYLPSPHAVASRFPAGFPIGFKIAPGVPLDELGAFEGEAEFISLNGELKECALWLGPLQTTARRATVLPTGLSIAAEEPAEAALTTQPLRYVYDPDPALMRSGLVTNFAQSIDGRLLDSLFGFVTSDRLAETPFATAYEVETALPFHAKRLGEWMRSHNVGRVTPVKRGSSVDTDELVRRWKLRGDEHRAVLLTECDGRAVAIIGNRVLPS